MFVRTVVHAVLSSTLSVIWTVLAALYCIDYALRFSLLSHCKM